MCGCVIDCGVTGKREKDCVVVFSGCCVLCCGMGVFVIICDWAFVACVWWVAVAVLCGGICRCG